MLTLVVFIGVYDASEEYRVRVGPVSPDDYM